jgi:biofilm PGA synthesis N-glycosyltransferase PgaC
VSSLIYEKPEPKEIMRSRLPMGYVLVTAAKNESRYIESTIHSVIAQTLQPDRWVIVSDGSTDGMDDIVSRYADDNCFIQLRRLDAVGKRDYSSKAIALNHGVSTLAQFTYEFLGCLDADIVLEPDYYEKILSFFAQDPLLGVAGGSILESTGANYVARRGNRRRSVPGAIQVFRESCFRRLGVYLPLRYGGEDTVLEVRARMLGFHVSSFPCLRACHLRRTGYSDRLLRRSFREGLQEYEIGYHPLYEFLKCLSRLRVAPPFLGSISQLLGFLFAFLVHKERIVPRDQVSFMRKEQSARIRGLFSKISLSAIE